MRRPCTDNLPTLLSSEARFRVLRVFSLTEGSLGLRELERSTQIAIRSIQVATQALSKDGVLKKDRQNLFRLNAKHPDGPRLRAMFQYLQKEELKDKANALSTRAQRAVRLCDDVRDLLTRRKLT